MLAHALLSFLFFNHGLIQIPFVLFEFILFLFYVQQILFNAIKLLFSVDAICFTDEKHTQ